MKNPLVVIDIKRKYTGIKLNAIRPNSMDMFNMPSRFENNLHYPNGVVEYSPKPIVKQKEKR